MARAKKGGEFGANGEWYEGGKFLNTVPENHKKEGSKPKKARKVEVEPYKWVEDREGFRPIWSLVSAIGRAFLTNRPQDVAPQTWSYLDLTPERFAELRGLWEAGERWVAI